MTNWGRKPSAVTAVSPTFPAVELETTQRIAAEIGANHRILETDQLEIPEFVLNDATRCYHCKTDLYSLLGKLRGEYEASSIVDGTNRRRFRRRPPWPESRAGMGCPQPVT